MTGADLVALMKKHKLTSVAVLISVVCAVVVYFRGGAIEEKTSESAAKAEEAAKIKANITNSANLPEQVEAIKGAVGEIESRLVRPGQLATNLQYFYRLEADTGVKILDARQGNVPANRPGPKTAYVGVPYSVSVQGTFAQTLAFLRRLETGRHFAKFVSVTYTKAGGAADASSPANLMTLSINVELLGQP
jgi:Tfp pilus assembly protein PilO